MEEQNAEKTNKEVAVDSMLLFNVEMLCDGKQICLFGDQCVLDVTEN